MARERREAKETGRMLLCDVALLCKRIVPAFYPAGSNVHFSYRLLLLCGEQTIHFPKLNSTESLTWRTKLTANWLKTYFIALRRTHFFTLFVCSEHNQKGII
jgi:hypothetical protein